MIGVFGLAAGLVAMFALLILVVVVTVWLVRDYRRHVRGREMLDVVEEDWQWPVR